MMKNDEEMMEIPYGGTFSWPEHEFHSSAMSLGQLGSSANGTQHGGGNSIDETDVPPKLSAEDIAAFMHINAVDRPFRPQ